MSGGADPPPKLSIGDFNQLMQLEHLALEKARLALEQRKQEFEERRWGARFALEQALAARERGFPSLRQFYEVLAAPADPAPPSAESDD